MSEREQRRTEIEQTFDYDGYQVARRELFAHLRDLAIIIRKDSIAFNTAWGREYLTVRVWRRYG